MSDHPNKNKFIKIWEQKCPIRVFEIIYGHLGLTIRYTEGDDVSYSYLPHDKARDLSTRLFLDYFFEESDE